MSEMDEVVEMAEGVHTAYKVIIAVVAIFMAGMGTGIVITNMTMPNDLEALEVIQEEHVEFDHRIEHLEKELPNTTQIICILELQLEGAESQDILDQCRPPLFQERGDL